MSIVADAAAEAACAWLRRVAPDARDLRIDSRAVEPGDVFVAMRGARADGRAFAAAAAARGAAALLLEDDGTAAAAEVADVPAMRLPALGAALGRLADLYYGRPSAALLVVGVTGTNGKTSSTFWIAQLLAAIGRRCAVIGTLGAGFPGEALDRTGLTTPDAASLHRTLRALAARGADAAAIEVSSIGLEQGRVDGVAFDCALFTNLSRDHLDYHGSMAAYRDAKARLFAWPGLRLAAINLDDGEGEGLARDALRRGLEVTAFGFGAAAPATAARLAAEAGTAASLTLLTAHDVQATASGLAFDVVRRRAAPAGGEQAARVATPLLGLFNVSNLLGVIAIATGSGVPLAAAAAGCPALRAPPGRMERIEVDRGGAAVRAAPIAIVDYAHTPDAIEQALAALRPMAGVRGGRLWIVFGAGGDRDPGKRGAMGAVAARLADRVVVTSDNPRSEDPAAIVEQVAAGAAPARAGGGSVIECIVDRAEAIASALARADAADVVLIAGKGHEPEQEIGGRKLPFSDPVHARAALERRR